MIALDEELWFGTPGDDAELEERAAASMAAVAARVLGAKPFPAAAKRLEELTRSPNAKIQQVVGVLESDPGLSMRLLRLVNSAGYALRVRCTSVRHAASLVGMRRLHQLATTAAVLDLFDGDRPVVRTLLTHAAIVGAISRYLAVHVDLQPDELFTCGFLHDIGKLMLLDAEGESYLELVNASGDQADTLHVLERERYGFDHAVLGAHVLKSWRIPNPVPRVVAWHHSVGRAYQGDPATAATVQALRLADQLSYLVRASEAPESITRAAESDAARYLGISEPQLAAMWQDLTRLAQRIGANPGASNEADVIPREESLPPQMRTKTSLAAKSAMSAAPPSAVPTVVAVEDPLAEVPKHFVCVVCSKATHGHRCPVCSGHVCSAHQTGPEQWCTDCANVYSLEVGGSTIPIWGRVGAAMAIGVAGLISVVVALLSDKPLLEAFVGAVLLASVCVMLAAVGRRVLLKRGFLHSRGRVIEVDEESTVVAPASDPTPTSDAHDADDAAAVHADGAEPSFPSHAPLPFGLSVPPAPEIHSASERYRGSQPMTEPPAPEPASIPPVFSAPPVPSAPPMPSASPHANATAVLSAPPTRSLASNPPNYEDDNPFRPIERTEPALRLVNGGLVGASGQAIPKAAPIEAQAPGRSVPAPVEEDAAYLRAVAPTALHIPAPIRALTPVPPAPSLPPVDTVPSTGNGARPLAIHNTRGAVKLVGCVASAAPRFNACSTATLAAPLVSEARPEGRTETLRPSVGS
jgi:putative nucleotidyltransferase with HDIG domain